MRFAIYGSGGFGREVAPIARDFWLNEMAPVSDETKEDIVFVDDAAAGSEANGLPVLTFDQLCSNNHKDRHVVVAIGDGRTRKKVEDRCIAAGLIVGTVRAPSARILEANNIGAGSVLCDFVTITANAKIGKGFQANIYSYVAHDCVVGDYVTFAPRVSCNGNVRIGDFVYVGTGAMFVQGTAGEPLTIGEGAIIGMGAVVTKPVEPYTLVAGNPARVVRKLDSPEN